jgi:fructosamine-3-kinase
MMMVKMFEEEAASRRRGGRDDSNEEWDKIKTTILHELIPRLLDPLEAHGRKVTTCLIHSDSWPGNMKLREGAGNDVVMFDGAGFWGHNEADLLCCHRPDRYFMTHEYIKAYFDLIPPAEPVYEAYDRVWLYAL